MKFVYAILAVAGLALVGCGGGGSEEACTEAETAYNEAGAECYGTAVTWTEISFSCETYADISCAGVDEYFACVAEVECTTTAGVASFSLADCTFGGC